MEVSRRELGISRLEVEASWNRSEGSCNLRKDWVPECVGFWYSVSSVDGRFSDVDSSLFSKI